MERTVIEGQLEIDHERGVIWFNSEQGACVLRICRLPRPIPTIESVNITGRMLDVTHMHGCDWVGEISLRS